MVKVDFRCVLYGRDDNNCRSSEVVGDSTKIWSRWWWFMLKVCCNGLVVIMEQDGAKGGDGWCILSSNTICYKWW